MVVGYWTSWSSSSSSSSSSTAIYASVHVHIYSTAAAATGDPFCTCRADAGFACVAVKHLTDEERAWRKVLARLERRARFREFVGDTVDPSGATAQAGRWHQSAGATRRRRDNDWRTRALGKRPGRIASG